MIKVVAFLDLNRDGTESAVFNVEALEDLPANIFNWMSAVRDGSILEAYDKDDFIELFTSIKLYIVSDTKDVPADWVKFAETQYDKDQIVAKMQREEREEKNLRHTYERLKRKFEGGSNG